MLTDDFLDEHLVKFALETLAEHWNGTLEVGAVILRIRECEHQP
jgi:hypothetical protein